MQYAAFLLLPLLAIESAGRAVKPASKYFQICHKSDPEIASCIKDSIKSFGPSLLIGIPELQIAPQDPLFVPKMEMKDGSGNFKFHQILTNLNIYGFRNTQIKDLTVDLAKNYITIKCFTKTIDFEGDYEMDGRVIVMEIKGKGRAYFNFTNVITTAYIQNEVIQREGDDYLRVKSLKWKIEPESAKLHFTNLFNGDKRLGDATNNFLNENWKEAYSIYRSLPEEALGTLVKDLANKVFSMFPKDELLPE